MTVRKFVTDLLARGQCCFSTQDAVQALGTSVIATRAALRRLQKKGDIIYSAGEFWSTPR